MRHFVIVGILIIAVTALLIVGLDAANLMPVEASLQAGEIDGMWKLMEIAMSFLFALIVVPMVYSLAVFKRKQGDTSDAEHVEGNTRLEIAWSVLPLIAVLVFSVLGAGNLANTVRPSADAMVIKVVGSQWSWRFDYPEYGFSSKEMYVPVNKAIDLKMESTDVIHSFWVPEFRVKQDLVPGRVTELRITPIRLGDYKVRCAELCGTSHYSMEQPVVVVDEEAFSAWVLEQKAIADTANATPEGRGQLLVQNNPCGACHSITGAAGVGPTWRGLFESEVELEDGTIVIADEAYLIESIKNPKAKIVKGFPPTMPVFPFTDKEIEDIVAYIKTLK
jgi:cytochrome c oxidase, subunit II